MSIGFDDDEAVPPRRAGLLPDELEPGQSGDDTIEEQYAVGTPGGGTASGGLAGTNLGDGSPDEVDLNPAMDTGRLDHSGDKVDEGAEESGGAESSAKGGAVGGTPAGKRGRGRGRRGVASGSDSGADSTIGRDPRRK
jgi:hypothetical protein